MRVFDLIFRNRYFSLIVSFLLCAVSGTSYLFSVYGPFVKQTFDYDQTQLEFVSTFISFAQYLAPLNGFFFDFFGPRLSSVVGGVINFLGYFLVWLALKKVFWSNAALIGFFFMLSGFGRSFLYSASLGANLDNFEQQNRGKILGSMLAMYGLSAAIFTGLYQGLFAPDIEKLILFLGVFPCAVSFFSAIFIFRTKKEPIELKPEETGLLDVSEEDDRIKKLVESLPEVTPLRVFTSLEIYIIFPTFLVATGVGLMVIANIGSIVLSLGKPDGSQNIYVTILSVFNAIGRIGVGIGGDFLARYVNRPIFYTLSIFLIGVAALLMSFGDLNLLGVGVALTGFAFGSVWGV